MKRFDHREDCELQISSGNGEALESNDASEHRGEISKYGSKIKRLVPKKMQLTEGEEAYS
jgi:hypothetical protein